MTADAAVSVRLGISVPPWMADALCCQVDPELFFPEKGASSRDAIKVCRQCPVAAACLDYALEVTGAAHDYGVWGGTTAHERRTIRQQLNPDHKDAT